MFLHSSIFLYKLGFYNLISVDVIKNILVYVLKPERCSDLFIPVCLCVSVSAVY